MRTGRETHGTPGDGSSSPCHVPLPDVGRQYGRVRDSPSMDETVPEREEGVVRTYGPLIPPTGLRRSRNETPPAQTADPVNPYDLGTGQVRDTELPTGEMSETVGHGRWVRDRERSSSTT